MRIYLPDGPVLQDIMQPLNESGTLFFLTFRHTFIFHVAAVVSSLASLDVRPRTLPSSGTNWEMEAGFISVCGLPSAKGAKKVILDENGTVPKGSRRLFVDAVLTFLNVSLGIDVFALSLRRILKTDCI